MLLKEKYKLIQIVGLLLFPLFIGSLFFETPFISEINLIDEGQFAAWANHMIHGKLMYKDIYITYGPLYIYPLYLAFKIFGPTAFAVKIYLSVIGFIISTGAILLLTNRIHLTFTSRLILLLGLLLLPGMNLRMGVAYWIIFFIVKAYYSKKIVWDLLVGILTVVSFLISPETGIFCIFLVIVIYLVQLFVDPKKNVGKGIVSFGGIFFAAITFILWAYFEGWLVEYIAVTLDVFVTFSGMNLPNGQGFPNPLVNFPSTINVLQIIKFTLSQQMLILWQLFFYICVFIYCIIRFLTAKFNQEDAIIFLINLYATFLYFAIIGRHGGFYFTLVPLFIYSIYFGQKILTAIQYSKNNSDRFVAICLLAFISLFMIRVVLLFRPHFEKVQNLPSVTKVENELPRVGLVSISLKQKKYIKDYQEFINTKTKKSDFIFILTNEAGIYMLVDRLNPTRYDLPYVAVTKEKRLELLNDLAIRKPLFIFEDTGAWEIDGLSNRMRLPEVWNFISKNYLKHSVFGDVVVYKRK